MGLLFTGVGTFNAVRAQSLWSNMRRIDKGFNIGVISMIYVFAGMSFFKGYEIYMGKQMDLIELRPSYT